MDATNLSSLRRTCLLSVAFLAFWTASPAGAAVQYRWVQLVEGETLNDILQPRVLVRAIVDQKDACPTLYGPNGRMAARMMERRRDRALNNFDEIKLCQAAFDASNPLVQNFTTLFFDADAKQEAGILPNLTHGVPVSNVVAFGCTGCRGEKDAQPHCDANSEWFFQRINTDAVTRTKDKIPPLVAYMGDMRYAGQEEVDDSWAASAKPSSNTLLGWREEVFEPTKALMERGLWVVMRGNHEGCYVESNDWSNATDWRDRGSAWLYFFGDGDLTCTDVADPMHDVLPPFAMDAMIFAGSTANPVASGETLRLVFLDTVRTGDDRDKEPDDTRKYYRKNFDAVATRFVEPVTDDRPIWLLGHIPPYGMKGDFEPNVVTEALGGSKLEKHLPRVRLAAAAHIHRFNLVNAGMGNPAVAGPVQFVAGNSGVAVSGSDDDLVCDRDDVKWTPDDGDKREEKWVGVRTSNYGYMIASFSVNAEDRVTADYRAPMFDSRGASDPRLEVACSGDPSDWSRLSCPSFTKTESDTPKCAE